MTYAIHNAIVNDYKNITNHETLTVQELGVMMKKFLSNVNRKMLLNSYEEFLENKDLFKEYRNEYLLDRSYEVCFIIITQVYYGVFIKGDECFDLIKDLDTKFATTLYFSFYH